MNHEPAHHRLLPALAKSPVEIGDRRQLFVDAHLVTRPVRFNGNRLFVNYSTSAVRTLRVELQDVDGRPIKGYTLAECPEIYGDRIDGEIRWASGGDLAPLKGRTLRLRFVLGDADLYAFGFGRRSR